MKDEITLYLPWPDKKLASNSRVHWAVKAKAVKAARKLAYWQAFEAGVTPEKTGIEPEIFVEYWPKHRRFDPQNVPHALKAYIDGVADALESDDRRFRVHYPAVFAGTRPNGEIIFRIIPKMEI